MEDLSFDDLMYLAIFIYDQGNYEQSIKYMKSAIEKKQILSSEEQELFIQPFRDITGNLRNQIRACKAELTSEDLESESQVIALELLKKELITSLISYCKDVIAILSDKILPATTEDVDKPKIHLFIGDFARYIAECDTDESIAMAELSHDNYATALTLTAELYPAAHPIRLNAALNLSILVGDIMSKYDDALELLQNVHNEAAAHLNDLEPEDAKIAEDILKNMRDNIVEWSGADE